MRVIARLDVKNQHVIKGIHLEGLRKVGDPNKLALQYYEAGIDELIFMDAVASLYDRNSLFEVISQACENTFVPLTLGGGIRSIEDIEQALRAGADKVAINTSAVRNPQFISKAASIYGRQCIVGSIEAKRIEKENRWEVFVDNGRERTGLDVLKWAEQLECMGVGELLVTSIDQEGTKRGFDVELYHQLYQRVDCPIVVSGGYGKSDHINNLCGSVGVSGIAFASVFHYQIESVAQIKYYLNQCGQEIRL